jgi:hypothetical protein
VARPSWRLAASQLRSQEVREEASLRLQRYDGAQRVYRCGTRTLALLAGLSGDARSAAQLLGYVDAQHAALETQREPTEQWGYDKLMPALSETPSADEIAQLPAHGAAWSEDQAVEEALKG